jgi:hypothetical protein
MTARVNIFKQPKPAKSEYSDGMSVFPSLCREEEAPNMARLPGERKESGLSVDNCPNVVRGHKV